MLGSSGPIHLDRQATHKSHLGAFSQVDWVA